MDAHPQHSNASLLAAFQNQAENQHNDLLKTNFFHYQRGDYTTFCSVSCDCYQYSDQYLQMAELCNLQALCSKAQARLISLTFRPAPIKEHTLTLSTSMPGVTPRSLNKYGRPVPSGVSGSGAAVGAQSTVPADIPGANPKLGRKINPLANPGYDIIGYSAAAVGQHLVHIADNPDFYSPKQKETAQLKAWAWLVERVEEIGQIVAASSKSAANTDADVSDEEEAEDDDDDSGDDVAGATQPLDAMDADDEQSVEVPAPKKRKLSEITSAVSILKKSKKGK